MKIPGIKISPRPNREQAEVGNELVRWGITNLIGISRPVATVIITLLPPVNTGEIKTQNIS